MCSFMSLMFQEQASTVVLAILRYLPILIKKDNEEVMSVACGLQSCNETIKILISGDYFWPCRIVFLLHAISKEVHEYFW